MDAHWVLVFMCFSWMLIGPWCSCVIHGCTFGFGPQKISDTALRCELPPAISS